MVSRKSLHKSILWDIKDLYNNCIDVNRWLFEADQEYNWRNYKRDIEMNETKKKLDNDLKLCLRYLYSELSTIETMIYNNEIKFDVAV